MAPLKNALVVLATFCLAACAKDPPAQATHDTPPAPPPPTRAATVTLGAPIPANATLVTLSDVAKNPKAFDGKSITTTGTVTSVCQAMGCWMEIKDDASQAHIKMAGHGFFVPKTAAGRKARVTATVASNGESCNEDDCHPADTDPKAAQLAKIQLEATGVELD